MQARHGLGERLQRRRHVPRRPRGEPEEPGRTAPREMVVGAGQVEGAPGVLRRARHIAARLGERGPVDGDGRRQRPQLLGVGPRVSLRRRARQPARVPRRRVGPRPPSRSPETIEHVPVEDAEHRAAPDGVVGQGLQPAEQHRFLPVASDRRHGQLHQVTRRGRSPARPGRAGPPPRPRSCALVPPAGALVQQRHQVGLLGEQARPQHVGEQVVVAVPLPPVVQRRRGTGWRAPGSVSMRLPSSRPVTRVAQRPGEPVEHRGAAAGSRAPASGWWAQHLLDEVVDDVPVVAGEPGDEAADVRRAPAARGRRAAARRSSPRCAPRGPRCLRR